MNPKAKTYEEAVGDVLAEFAGNPWFLDAYWPENRLRIERMARRALAQFPEPFAKRVLEVGCATGYVAYLFRQLGFQVDAVDAYDDARRTELFRRAGINYRESNLNVVAPLSEFADQTYDVVLLGEVFEHILNQPAGLLQQVHRILRPGGLLILTTPNPSTLANAVRVLRDGYLIWGTREFLRETKVDAGRIIDRGDIHYREYPAWVVQELLQETGFCVDGSEYIQSGIAPSHSAVKRFIKGALNLTGLARLRILSLGYLISARRPATSAGKSG